MIKLQKIQTKQFIERNSTSEQYQRKNCMICIFLLRVYRSNPKFQQAKVYMIESTVYNEETVRSRR